MPIQIHLAGAQVLTSAAQQGTPGTGGAQGYRECRAAHQEDRRFSDRAR